MKNLEDYLYPLLNGYKKSPQIIKNIIGGIYSRFPDKIIYGDTYNNFRKIIKNAASFSEKEILEYQWIEIQNVLDVAFTSIPFYQSLYADYGIKQSHIQNFTDFEKLPIINKQEIKENIDFITSSKYKNQKLKMNTGGSTGSPLEFYIHKGITRPKERAFLNSFFYSLGYNRKQISVTFRGDVVPEKKIYMYDPIRKNYIFSSYRITAKNIRRIVYHLNKINPDFIFGYPSVVYDISSLLKSDSSLHLNLSLKGIILLSEKLFDFQIKLIEETFNTNVFCYYGHSERLVLGYKCRHCNNYLIDQMYGYAELVDKNHIPITDTGVKGKIIGSGFHNLVMPLIRYDTNDESSFTRSFCNTCHNSNSMIIGDIVGRTSDYLIGYDGRKISITGIIFGQHLKEFNKISKFQLVQSEPGKIHFNIVAENRLSITEETRLKKKIENASDYTISVKINYVKEIKKSSSGKFKYLKQDIQ